MQFIKRLFGKKKKTPVEQLGDFHDDDGEVSDFSEELVVGDSGLTSDEIKAFAAKAAGMPPDEAGLAEGIDDGANQSNTFSRRNQSTKSVDEISGIPSGSETWEPDALDDVLDDEMPTDEEMRQLAEMNRREEYLRSKKDVRMTPYLRQLQNNPDPFAALLYQKLWTRGDRFRLYSADWLSEGGAKLDPEDADYLEQHIKEEEPEDEKENSEHSDEDSVEREKRKEAEKQAELDRLEAEIEENERLGKLVEHPKNQGHLTWLKATEYKSQFASGNRRHMVGDRKRVQQTKKQIAHCSESVSLWTERTDALSRSGPQWPAAPSQDQLKPPRGPNDYDWFLAPSVQITDDVQRQAASLLGAPSAKSVPNGSQVLWCWRHDFVAEALKAATAHKMLCPAIDLRKAQEAFKKKLSYAYALHKHQEVVSLNGDRQLWSPDFIQSLEVLRRVVWKQQTATDHKGQGFDAIRLSVPELGKDFPPLSGRTLPLHRPEFLIYDDEEEAFGFVVPGDQIELLLDDPTVKHVRRWYPAVVVVSSELSDHLYVRLKKGGDPFEWQCGFGKTRRNRKHNRSYIMPKAKMLAKALEELNDDPPGFCPPVPEIPVCLPHKQIYKSTDQVWTRMAPPLKMNESPPKFNYQEGGASADDGFANATGDGFANAKTFQATTGESFFPSGPDGNRGVNSMESSHSSWRPQSPQKSIRSGEDSQQGRDAGGHGQLQQSFGSGDVTQLGSSYMSSATQLPQDGITLGHDGTSLGDSRGTDVTRHRPESAGSGVSSGPGSSSMLRATGNSVLGGTQPPGTPARPSLRPSSATRNIASRQSDGTSKTVTFSEIHEQREI